MFRLAESFNQPIGYWDVSKVNNFVEMFWVKDSETEKYKFRQNIRAWKVQRNSLVESILFRERYIPLNKFAYMKFGRLYPRPNFFNQPLYKNGNNFSLVDKTTPPGTIVDYEENKLRRFYVNKDRTLTESKTPIITTDQNIRNNVQIEDTSFNPLTGITAIDFLGTDISSSLQFTITPDFNVNIIGQYDILYTVEDYFGESSSLKRTINVVKEATPPVISFENPDNITLEAGSPIQEQIFASDNSSDTIENGGITISNNINEIDNKTPGSYQLIYTATDSYGNFSNVSKTITIVDTTPPEISFKNPNDIILEAGRRIQNEPVIASDNSSDTIGNKGIKISKNINEIDNKTPGSYQLIYTATDSSGNSSTVSKTITIVDTTPPVISFVNPNNITLEAGTLIQEQEIIVTDNSRDTIENGGIKISNNIDNIDTRNVGGLYTLKYIATDSSGNSSSIVKTISIVDTTPPEISFVNPDNIQLEINTPIRDEQVVVSDNSYDTLENGRITVTNNINEIDTSTAGEYILRYVATDSSGNSSTISKKVTFIDPSSLSTTRALLSLRLNKKTP